MAVKTIRDVALYQGLKADLATKNATAFARFLDEFGAEWTQSGNSAKGINGWLQTNTNGAGHVALVNPAELTVLAGLARTATINSADFDNLAARGIHCIINVTALSATPSITPIIQGKDPISGTYYDILEGLPITTVGINIIKVYPGISAVVNASASDILPRTYRLRVVHADADSITYSIAAVLIA